MATQQIIKSGDQSVTSSTVLVNDSDLQFAIGAHESWIVELVLFMTNSVASGLKVTMVGPSGSAGTFSATLDGVAAAAGFFPLGTADGIGPATTTNLVKMTATVRNGATPGTVALQFAQAVSDTTPVVVKLDSFLFAFRVV
jgi:hypothetical protein